MDNSSSQTGFTQQERIYNTNPPRNLPNANLILILGILSILLCWWHLISLAGIILGTLSLVMAKNETRRYLANPAGYTVSSYNNVKTGRICAIIGLAISVIVFVFVVLMIIGILVTLPFWGMIQ